MVDQICGTAHPLRDIHIYHIAELTVPMECHQFDFETGKTFISLLPDGNTSEIMNNNRVTMLSGSLVIKNGVSYDIVDGGYQIEVVATLPKRPDAKFKWTDEYIRVRFVSRRDGEVLMY